MENNFYKTLNKNTIAAVQRDAAFFMKSNQTRVPIINNTLTGTPVSGANYFNLMLSNDLNGTAHTEYAPMNKVYASSSDRISVPVREDRPRGVVCRDDAASGESRYTFMIPTEAMPNDTRRDTREPRDNYIPFQSNDAPISDFEQFVQEQCVNAVNASLTNSVFKSAINERDIHQFKTQLINEITQNPQFMAAIADKAHREVMDSHYVPFDKKQFIEKARNENSAEFEQLNSAITNHVQDMRHNQKPSFNREFDELSRPLVINIENLYIGNPQRDQKPAAEQKITEFIKEKIKQDKPASILADTFAGTFIEKAKKLAQNGKRVFAGLVLACSLINPVLTATLQADDFTNITNAIVSLQELKGNNDLKTSSGHSDTSSFYASLSETIRDNPQTLEKAIEQVTNKIHHNQNTTSSTMTRSR